MVTVGPADWFPLVRGTTAASRSGFSGKYSRIAGRLSAFPQSVMSALLDANYCATQNQIPGAPGYQSAWEVCSKVFFQDLPP